MGDTIASFLKYLLDKSDTKVDKEYLKILDEYKEIFGHTVPTEMLPPNISDDEVKKAMEECIKNHKDTLLDILNVSIDDNVLY